MNKETLKYVLRQTFEAGWPPTRPRALALPLAARKIILLRGIRRCGKTSLFHQTMDQLEHAGVSRAQILYLNLEDDRLYPIRAEELDLILQAHAELFPEAQRKARYLFLDEIQAVPGWERFVRRVHETEPVRLFITGSAPHLLGREIAPVLRGRSLSYELLPLSFAEALQFRGLVVERYSRTSEAAAVHALEDYLRWGGFPEILLAEEALRRKIITEYADLLYYRDLLDQFPIRNESVMRLLLKHCLSQPASLISAHKLFQDFRSQGFSLSKNTVYEYLHFLVDAGLVCTVPIFDRSLRKQEQNPKKLFLVDLGLMQAFTVRPDQDLGRKLENLIFLKKRALPGGLFYLSSPADIDLVHSGAGGETFTNVCWTMETPEAARRELTSLSLAAQRFPKASFELISHERGRGRIPAGVEVWRDWEYLLSSGSEDDGRRP